MTKLKTFKSLRWRIPAILFASFSLAPAYAVDWIGYINDKSLQNGPYGYIVNTSTVDGHSKLKLVCFPPDNFRLYLDDFITRNISIADIGVSVDRLSPIKLEFQRTGTNLSISNNTTRFWDLIAQMSAGASFNLTLGTNLNYQYSLKGFTSAYQDNCGWMSNAGSYRLYLDRYQ